MATIYGLTDDGFVSKPLAAILAEIEDQERTDIAPEVDVSTDEPLGQINGIFAAQIAELWEVAQAVHAARDPNQSSGAALDAVANLTGTQRLAPTAGTVGVFLTGDAEITVVAGKQAVDLNGHKWNVRADVALELAMVWQIGTIYVAGNVRSNGTRTYVCITGGTSAGSGGPTGTGDNITDNTAHWAYVGEGTYVGTGTVDCDETGAIPAFARTVNAIQTPVSHWLSVINVDDATPGTDEETDAALRLRREAELQRTGTSPIDAIRADLLEVAEVTAVHVFENVEDTTDGDGLPPHSINAVVLGGTNAAIAAQLLRSISAGTNTYGGESETVTDEQGDDHVINFGRPVELTLYITVYVTTDPDVFPVDGSDQIKAALVAWCAAHLGMGDDVIRSKLIAAVLEEDDNGNALIAGITDVSNLKLGYTSTPSGTSNLGADPREIAVASTSRIVVNVS